MAEPGTESPADLTRPTPLWRQVLPYAIAAALVTWVLWSLDLDGFVRHLKTINYPAFIGFAVALTAATVLLDSIATCHVYRRVLGPIRFREFLIIRAASYLPTLVNHHVGQAWMTYFLSRVYDVKLWRVAGATLLVYATILGGLVLVGALSVLFEPLRFAWLPPVIAILLAAGAAYLVVLRVKPRVLAERQLTAPLFEVGVLGHLVALAFRLPHIAILFVGAWVPFLFFGVDIPFSDALALIPPLLVMVSLPITPQGVGTRDAFAAQVFVAYAAGSVEEQRIAVAASTLTWAVTLTLIQIVMSLACYRPAQRLLAKRVVR